MWDLPEAFGVGKIKVEEEIKMSRRFVDHFPNKVMQSGKGQLSKDCWVGR